MIEDDRKSFNRRGSRRIAGGIWRGDRLHGSRPHRVGRGSEYAIAFIDRLATRLQAPILYAQPLNPLLSQARALTCGPVVHHPATSEFLAGCDLVLALGDVFSDMHADTYDMAVSGKVVHACSSFDSWMYL